MTEEEIRPIAEQYVEEYCHCIDGGYTDGSLICAGIGTALIVARRLEKKNAELREQIEKMKGCYNCRHFTEPYKLCCYSLGDEDYDCHGRKWEIKEND